MLTEDIKQLNDHHANLKHYTKTVAESWYRIRDLMERTKELVEEKFKSDNTENNAIALCQQHCALFKTDCGHTKNLCCTGVCKCYVAQQY